jgi:thioredoxin-dependent peroxiredoxin
MSKKTRKKSPKTAARNARASATPRTQKAKTKPGPKLAASAKKSAKAKVPPAPSHKAASKTLKTPPPQKSSPPKTLSATSPGHDRNRSLAEGGKAPAFQLPRDGGAGVSLADYAGKKLVIFFYPRADTPGCTKEAMDFSRLADAFANSGTAVLGVSADAVSAQEAFRDKHRLSIPLVSDEAHATLNAYGVWGEKSMYGKTFMGTVRTTVLIDRSGKVARIWRNVKVDGHADEVLAAARAL